MGNHVAAGLTRALHIRTYQERDWSRVCEIYDLAKPDELAGVVEPGRILALEADARMRELFAASSVTVAELGAELVGFAGSRGSFITWLFVHPASRRSGVATALLVELLARLERPATLNVAAGNAPARSLYERLGFQVVREFAGSFQGAPCNVVKLQLP
jgi:ribosomal protein S18 acetylase RimI-like enzyme